jgi:hypothetical protein
VKDILHELVNGMSRWPLLLGSLLCYSLVIYEEMFTDLNEVAMATTGVVVGSMLLGAWVVSYVIDGERRNHRQHRRTDDCGQTSAPPATGETQSGAEGSEG